MDDKELILRLHQDDESAFDIIFRKYYKWLCGFAHHYVRNQAASEEIVQEFFCHFWDNCSDISINTSLQSYLFRSIHNRCLNFIRDEKVRQRHLSENHKLSSENEFLFDSVPSFFESGIDIDEMENKIKLAIDDLPEQCRTVFCLNRFEDLSYPEIAGKLDISVNTVKTQMARALRKLRDSLKFYLDNSTT